MLANQYPDDPEDRLDQLDMAVEAMLRLLTDEQFEQYMGHLDDILAEQNAGNN